MLIPPTPTIRLHLRLWRQCALVDAMRLTEYRANFAFGVVRQFASLVLTIFGFGVLYQYTDSVAGWSRAEILVLLGIFWTFNAVWDLLLDGLSEISRDVRYGTLDFVLLRPVSAQFLLSLRRVSLLDLLNVALGVALITYAGSLAGIQLGIATVGRVAIAALLCVSGLVSIYSLRFMIVTCTIWLVGVQNLHDLLHPVFQVGQYPVTFFKGWVRAFLSFVVPVAFATTFPAQALLGTLDLRVVPPGVLLAAGALYTSHRFWHFAIRHYSSATS